MSKSYLSSSPPEALGIPSGAILDFVTTAEAEIDALHSFVLLRHGRTAAAGWWAPYARELPHMLFSLSKSFTSTAVGLAVTDGLLTVADPVTKFFPDDVPETVSDGLAAMQVRHLLTMTTGHAEEPMGKMWMAPDDNWAKPFLAEPVVHEPGTRFLYSTGASYMLSAIVQSLTGRTILDYLTDRVLTPLGIEGATWDTCPRGINTGGFGLWLKTEDIARFGQLMLQQGRWGAEQLVPAAWVAEATARQVDNAPSDNPDWEQGYAYQFWRCRHNAYRGDGAFGQYCIVMPDQDAVLAITSGVPDMQAVLDLVWSKLLPAMAEAPLAEDAGAAAALADKLADLALQPVAGQPFSPQAIRARQTAACASGRTYAFDLDAQRASAERHMPPPDAQLLRSIAFDFDDRGGTVTIADGRGPSAIDFGYGEWRTGMTALGSDRPQRVAASAAWQDARTLAIKLCLYETPFRPTLTCRFEDGHVRYRYEANVAFGPTAMPELIGKEQH